MANGEKEELSYVRLDVGHYLYLCHINILRKYPDSVLAKYVKPEFDTRTSCKDFIIIDRDGKLFGLILKYLHDGDLLCLRELDKDKLANLKREANFYCLTELEEFCRERIDNLTRWYASKFYVLPVAEDLGYYLSNSVKPLVVLDENWIILLGQTGMLHKVATLADRRFYDVIGCASDFKLQLRLYNPHVSHIVLAQDNEKPERPDSGWVVLRLCSYLMRVDSYFRELGAKLGGSSEEWAELEMERKKKEFIESLDS